MGLSHHLYVVSRWVNQWQELQSHIHGRICLPVEWYFRFESKTFLIFVRTPKTSSIFDNNTLSYRIIGKHPIHTNIGSVRWFLYVFLPSRLYCLLTGLPVRSLSLCSVYSIVRFPPNLIQIPCTSNPLYKPGDSVKKNSPNLDLLRRICPCPLSPTLIQNFIRGPQFYFLFVYKITERITSEESLSQCSSQSGSSDNQQ